MGTATEHKAAVAILALALLSCLATGLEPDAAAQVSKADIVPAVIGKIMPVFFERASRVVIQLVRDNLSKARLGDLETYADGKACLNHTPSLHATDLFLSCEKDRQSLHHGRPLLCSIICMPQHRPCK